MSNRRSGSTRRGFLWMAASTAAMAQGVAPRNIKPHPRGKPSGIPFLARFTDVAAGVGLAHPVVYGGLHHKDYIVETVGCGIAFFDYDNDGWLDILMLCGTRMEDPPPAPPIDCTKIIVMVPLPMSQRRPDLFAPVGPAVSPSVTTITTVSTIFSSLTMVRMFSTEITETAHSPMSPGGRSSLHG